MTLQENKRLASENYAVIKLLEEYKAQAQNGGSTASISGAESPVPGQASNNNNSVPTMRVVLQHIKEFHTATARVMAHYPAKDIIVVSQKLEGLIE